MYPNEVYQIYESGTHVLQAPIGSDRFVEESFQ